MVGEAPLAPKDGARFHFEMPGSVQGFEIEDSVESKGAGYVGKCCWKQRQRESAVSPSIVIGSRPAGLRRAATPTFTPSIEIANYFEKRGYELHASPMLYNGQTVTEPHCW